jgi:AcrR family transcriptional regulator
MKPTIDPFELPVLEGPPVRADAARNRRRILAAADRLFTRDGVACTSMDAIAAEAGVGKGTLFRRFGDRASLAMALLDSSERVFQDSFIRGPGPLGPGAPPLDRLVAFGRALLEHVSANCDLLWVGQSAVEPGVRFAAGPYGAYHAHVSLLISQADPRLDADYTADALLAPLNVEMVVSQLRFRAMTVERLAAGWETLVRGVLAAAPSAENDA